MRDNSRLARRLSAAVEGSVLADTEARARCATGAPIYQMLPDAVGVPRTVNDIEATMKIDREEAVPGLPRADGTPRRAKHVARLLTQVIEQ